MHWVQSSGEQIGLIDKCYVENVMLLVLGSAWKVRTHGHMQTYRTPNCGAILYSHCDETLLVFALGCDVVL